jgi:hypothetical protein
LVLLKAKPQKKTQKFLNNKKFKCPHWCAQIRLDLSNEGIKNPNGS